MWHDISTRLKGLSVRAAESALVSTPSYFVEHAESALVITPSFFAQIAY
jgi:hypothetical protein